MMRGLVLATLIAGAMLASPAIACPPPPPDPPPPAAPPGTSPEAAAEMLRIYREQLAKTKAEAEAAATRAWQSEMWDKADLVFVARVAQTRTKATPALPEATQVDLMPLTSLKAQVGPWQFELGYTGMTSCGPIPGFSAIDGKPGEEFIIYVTGDTPMQDTVLMTWPLKALVESRALAALKAQE